MTIQTREEALRRANASETNVEGMCQQKTRSYYDAPSAGDADRDGDSDAADGFYVEPAWAKHLGDRNPPDGVPLYFSKNAGKGNGHRCIAKNGGGRSTDFDGSTKKYKARVMGDGTLAQIEKAMGVTYVGWTDTIDGFPIPTEAKPPGKKSRGVHVDRALDQLRKALHEAPGAHKKKINDAKFLLLEIPAE